MRIGHGYDVHRFAKGRKLMLCGVEVDYELGLLGHSDADAALHALADSILGAWRWGTSASCSRTAIPGTRMRTVPCCWQR